MIGRNKQLSYPHNVGWLLREVIHKILFRFGLFLMINLVLHVKLKIALENKKRPKRSQMAKFIFRGQARKKKAKFELFGLQEANLATLNSKGLMPLGQREINMLKVIDRFYQLLKVDVFRLKRIAKLLTKGPLLKIKNVSGCMTAHRLPGFVDS